MKDKQELKYQSSSHSRKSRKFTLLEKYTFMRTIQTYLQNDSIQTHTSEMCVKAFCRAHLTSLPQFSSVSLIFLEKLTYVSRAFHGLQMSRPRQLLHNLVTNDGGRSVTWTLFERKSFRQMPAFAKMCVLRAMDLRNRIKLKKRLEGKLPSCTIEWQLAEKDSFLHCIHHVAKKLLFIVRQADIAWPWLYHGQMISKHGQSTNHGCVGIIAIMCSEIPFGDLKSSASINLQKEIVQYVRTQFVKTSNHPPPYIQPSQNVDQAEKDEDQLSITVSDDELSERDHNEIPINDQQWNDITVNKNDTTNGNNTTVQSDLGSPASSKDLSYVENTSQVDLETNHTQVVKSKKHIPSSSAQASSSQSNSLNLRPMKLRLRSSTKSQAAETSSTPALDNVTQQTPSVTIKATTLLKKRNTTTNDQVEQDQNISNLSIAQPLLKKKRSSILSVQHSRPPTYPNISNPQDEIQPAITPIINYDNTNTNNNKLNNNYNNNNSSNNQVRKKSNLYQNEIETITSDEPRTDRANLWMPSSVMSCPFTRSQISKQDMTKLEEYLNDNAARQFDSTSLFQSYHVIFMATAAFFAVRRSELMLQGYTILKGFMNTQENTSLEQHVDALFRFVGKEFVTSAQNCGGRDTDVWGLLPKTSSRDNGWYQTLPEELEKVMTEKMMLSKAFIDAWLGKILSLLLPEDGHLPVLMFPDHGSVFFGMKKEAGRRRLPLCGDIPIRDESEKLKRYHVIPPLFKVFLMFSAQQPFVMRVWTGSHISLNVRKEDRSKTMKGLNSRLIVVPPYSVFVGRGDVVYTAATMEEMEMVFQGKYGDELIEGIEPEWKNDCFIDGFNMKGYVEARRGTEMFQQLVSSQGTIDVNDHNLQKVK